MSIVVVVRIELHLLISVVKYDQEDDDVIQKKLIHGDLPYVDPRYKERSFAEEKLIELMERCWIYNPDERISIFEAVTFLRDAVEENEKLININPS